MERLFAPARAGRLSVLEVGSLRGFLSVLPKPDLTAGVMLVLPAVIKPLLFVVHGGAVVHMPVPLAGYALAFDIRSAEAIYIYMLSGGARPKPSAAVQYYDKGGAHE